MLSGTDELSDPLNLGSRRCRSIQQMSAMGFTDMAAAADNDGWPYPDSDDIMNTERVWQGRCYDYGTDRHWRNRTIDAK